MASKRRLDWEAPIYELEDLLARLEAGTGDGLDNSEEIRRIRRELVSIKKKIYRTRELAKTEMSNYIDCFYNPTRRHSHLGGVSPEEFERAGRRRRRVH